MSGLPIKSEINGRIERFQHLLRERRVDGALIVLGSRNTEFVLEEGMTIALEPKYVFPGKGVVGIENTFVVTDRGMERFNRFPDDIAVI